ncbi:MAG: NAD(P)/FAD-dependent oxidoreductase [Clostridia bacterium]|nr:NAD(P)/FAD-dependent oxidoreductase [Clostridia bacterium]
MQVVVIGGGPAGMMAAIQASKNGNNVILLERMRTPGRKLSITGKGRGNLTNNVDISEFIKNVPGNGKFLYSAFNRFTNKDLIAYFNSLGVETKVERGERVFPVSDTAMSFVNALKKELQKYNVSVKVNSQVKKILVDSSLNKVIGVLLESGESINCDKIVLATGGKSYSATGSDGAGYKLAKELGHTIVEPKGSLIPLETYEKYDLQGLSLKNVAIKVYDDKKVIYEDFGEMLFTHFGVSGPIILSASAHVLRIKNIEEKLKNKSIIIRIDLKPALNFEKLSQRIQRDFEKYTKKQFKNSLSDLLPSKMIPEIIKLSKINPEKRVDEITKEEREQLVKLLKEFTVTIKKFRPIDEAIITAGGVSVKEINPQTMESKIVKGLFFAGEIIDVDAYTGGFNLQIAFSTGYVAGQ